MPAVAAAVLTESSVPRVISSQPTGSTASNVRARWAGLPGICERPPRATAPNNAYATSPGSRRRSQADGPVTHGILARRRVRAGVLATVRDR